MIGSIAKAGVSRTGFRWIREKILIVVLVCAVGGISCESAPKGESSSSGPAPQESRPADHRVDQASRARERDAAAFEGKSSSGSRSRRRRQRPLEAPHEDRHGVMDQPLAPGI